MKTTTIKGFAGLEYLVISGVPVRNTKHGDAIAADYAMIERNVARSLIEAKVPLRGLEVRFLRKTLGMSLERFAAVFEYSAAAILKWERAETLRLDPVNEIAVRSYVAEILKLKISGHFHMLLGNDELPVELKVAAS